MKKIPMRQCTGCRQQFPKKELTRVVKSKDNVVSIDLTGKKDGRGAYMCHNAECIARAKKSRALERLFECEVPAEIYDALAEGTK